MKLLVLVELLFTLVASYSRMKSRKPIYFHLELQYRTVCLPASQGY